MKRVLSIFMIMISVIIVITTDAQTTVTGNQKGTWTLAKSPYVISGVVTVKTGDTLTIQPGVEVQFPAKFFGNNSLSVEGMIKAIGTSNQNILFKGTGNPYISGNYAGPITIQSTSKNSEIKYSIFDSLGQYDNSGIALNILSNTSSVGNCIFRNIAGSGVYVGVPNVLLTNSFFQYNTKYDVQINPDYIKNIVGSNPLKIGLLSGMAGNDTLTSYHLSYSILQEVKVPTGKTLTIQPGVELIFPDYNAFGNAQLTVQGSIKAVGTSSKNIKFTADHTTNSLYNGPIIIEATSNYADLEYVNINNIRTIATSSSTDATIYVRSPYTTIKNCIIQNNRGVAIKIENNASPTISNNTFIANQYGDIYGSANAFTNINKNTDAQINVAGGTLTTSSKWPAQNGIYQYNLLGTVKVNSGATLTVGAGVTVDFGNNNGNINIDGTLAAIGTGTNRIKFTRPNGAYGGKVSFSNLSANSTLKYITMTRLGSTLSPANGVALELNTSAITIDHLTITSSNDTGLSIINGSPVILNSTFTSNKTGVLSKYGKAIFTNCSFTKNKFGLRNASINIADTVDARNCWWNNASGPKISTNPGGTGDSVSKKVKYNPFLLVKPSLVATTNNNTYTLTINQLNSNVVLYPNPAKNFAYVNINNQSGPAIVSLIDLNGKTIWQSSKNFTNKISIPIQNLASGTYLVQVKDDKETVVVKMVKE